MQWSGNVGCLRQTEELYSKIVFWSASHFMPSAVIWSFCSRFQNHEWVPVEEYNQRAHIDHHDVTSLCGMSEKWNILEQRIHYVSMCIRMKAGSTILKRTTFSRVYDVYSLESKVRCHREWSYAGLWVTTHVTLTMEIIYGDQVITVFVDCLHHSPHKWDTGSNTWIIWFKHRFYLSYKVCNGTHLLLLLPLR